MNSAALPTLAALVIQLALGLAVFQANPRKKSNQCFLLLSAVIAVWLGSVFFILTTGSGAVAAFYIRQASAAGALIFVVFNLLRTCIQKPNTRWRTLLHESRFWLIIGGTMALFCQTPFFLRGAEFGAGAGVGLSTVHPIYGQGSLVYVIYFFAAGIAVIISYLRALRHAQRLQHSELAFILIGAGVTFTTLVIAGIAGLFIERSRLIWFAPFRIVLFTIVIAYGITTRKIMDVGFFLRRAISYLLLTAYLLVLYTATWWMVSSIMVPALGTGGRTFGHVFAAIVVAFAMAPARGISQSFADRFFVGARSIDFHATVSKAAQILQSVSTLPELLERFAKTIAEAVGTDRVVILLREKATFHQAYPAGDVRDGSKIELYEAGALTRYVLQTQQPVVLDELYRMRSTPDISAMIQRMQEVDATLATGIFSRQHLVGVMVLGSRRSGRAYGSGEQSALQVLCGQLAVAIENAELFTEVQNAKLYNETLLKNLTTGVIAAGVEGLVTVFNREAEQITKLAANELLEKPVDGLPPALRDVINETLRSGERQENRELILPAGEGAVVVRASSSIFHGQEGQMLGALMVLTDITALKRLEQQIRRSDRLASLGTLSAGMAHEIKNPLVSIKTFAQLLPERYQDADFRDTFSNLIGHEIDRIDSLVNQLLRFARPAKPFLRPTHVHAVLEKSLMLVGHRLYQKEIKLSRLWSAEVDTIRADADQLEQVFLNFFLNAMDAMKQGGELTVATEIRSSEEWPGGVDPINGSNGRAHEVLRITVRDDGEGIKGEDIPHVFDPFFTTKDYGTGLGLSVVHGIVQEHGGQIEVESEREHGTAFYILLPLVRFEEEVAAA